jgi:hypothetical protein
MSRTYWKNEWDILTLRKRFWLLLWWWFPRPAVSLGGLHLHVLRGPRRPRVCSGARGGGSAVRGAVPPGGRSLATRPQREPGRRNLSTCLINGDAETAAQTGPRQPHKEEAPRPLPPRIDRGPLWRGQRGRRAGTWPILFRGSRPLEDPPHHRSPSRWLQVADLEKSSIYQGIGWGRTRPGGAGTCQ